MTELPPLDCAVRRPEPEHPPDVQFLASAELELAVSRADYWGPETREIPVSFLDVSDRATIDMILSHANAWYDLGCGIRFVWSQSGGRARVTTGAGGYWSALGKGVLDWPAGQPTMNLQGIGLRTAEGERRRVIRHEFGHLLGFEHEHLRPEIVADIDPSLAYPYYARTQGWGRATVDANVLRGLDSAGIMGSTAVDPASVMCYPIVSGITYSGRSYPGGADISPVDAAFSVSVYPRAAIPPPPPPPIVIPPPPPPPPPVTPKVKDLVVGAAAKASLPAGGEARFRFAVKWRRKYAVATRGTLVLDMDIYGPDSRATLAASDRDQSGLEGNAVVAATLARGTYLVRVAGATPDVAGPFQIKVAAL